MNLSARCALNKFLLSISVEAASYWLDLVCLFVYLFLIALFCAIWLLFVCSIIFCTINSKSFKFACLFFSPEISCQDEGSNQYFEGATWSVGKCIDCRCAQGTISCSRKIILASFLLFTQKLQLANEITFTEDCNQTECNVAKYIKRNKGICHG